MDPTGGFAQVITQFCVFTLQHCDLSWARVHLGLRDAASGVAMRANAPFGVELLDV